MKKTVIEAIRREYWAALGRRMDAATMASEGENLVWQEAYACTESLAEVLVAVVGSPKAARALTQAWREEYVASLGPA